MTRGLVAGTLALVAVPGTALAHAPRPAGPVLAAIGGAHPSHHHGPPASFLLLLLLMALVALALGWAIRRDHRVAPTILAFVLGLAGAEAAYHGVHHLGDRDAAEKCVVFAASAHVDGLAHERSAPPAPAEALEVVAPGHRALTLTPTLIGLHEGRAPPLPSSI
jgi:hypothetical protein